MTQILRNSNSYADATAIIVSHKDIQSAMSIMQEEFNTITKWCHDNGLVINPIKTKGMHIRSRNVPKEIIRIKFHNYDCLHEKYRKSNQKKKKNSTIQLQSVEEYKYLGVHLDHNFKWNIHIDNLQKKLRDAEYIIYIILETAPHTTC